LTAAEPTNVPKLNEVESFLNPADHSHFFLLGEPNKRIELLTTVVPRQHSSTELTRQEVKSGFSSSLHSSEPHVRIELTARLYKSRALPLSE
jgi:hypothetical protein